MKRVIAYTRDEAESRVLSTLAQSLGELVTFESYFDKAMFKQALKERHPDGIALTRKCSMDKKISVVQMTAEENVLEFFRRVRDTFGLDYEAVTEGKLSEMENLFTTNRNGGEIMTDDQVRNQLRQIVEENAFFSPADANRVTELLFSKIRGYGILDELLRDDEVTEIMVNGPEYVYVEKRGILQKTDMHFQDVEELKNVIDRIANHANKQIDETSPILDAILEDGSRVSAVLQGVATNGPTLTIRKYAKNLFTMDSLVENGSISKECADFLKDCVRSRYNIVISGGTGSGKTTMVGACLDYIPREQRIITIEDTAELHLSEQSNHVSMLSRVGNSIGAGAISIADLIVASLRMRPDRIVVGEVRGREAIDMLQAMNTGHDGSLTTAHANSPRDMLSRLETMVIQANEIPLRAIRGQIASAVDIIVQVGRMSDGSRKVTEICEVGTLQSDGEIGMNPLFRYSPSTDTWVKVGDLKNRWKMEIYGGLSLAEANQNKKQLIRKKGALHEEKTERKRCD